MTNPLSLALHGVSFRLPEGRLLFSGLDETFDARRTGLVGRNGVGKSLLARILAGELAPTQGACRRSGRAHYLAQQVTPAAGQTVADLAGVGPTLRALARIEAGSTRSEDFDRVGDRWQVREQLQQQLAAHRLAHLRDDTPLLQLSGGEAMRVALAGAFLSEADWLILDEPSNHLDAGHRQLLIAQLRHWRRGLIVVSHDRALLETMELIVELSDLGLRSYGGGYSSYERQQSEQRALALQQLAQRKAERRREERELDAQRERQERRQSQGAKRARVANQAPILLGLQKSRSESSAGRLRQAQQATREALALRVRVAASRVGSDAPVLLFAPDPAQALPERVAELREVLLPRGDLRPLNLCLRGAARIRLVGPNGSGKSTLLRLLAGRLAPRAGRCEVRVPPAYLDQSLSLLDPQRPILEQMLAVNRQLDEAALRTRLSLLGLDAERVQKPVQQLSGGERLKAALAAVLYADRPAQLLLLDEPANHLDLPSLQALEAMLLQYRGALVVAAHDERFLDRVVGESRLRLQHPS